VGVTERDSAPRALGCSRRRILVAQTSKASVAPPVNDISRKELSASATSTSPQDLIGEVLFDGHKSVPRARWRR
jgi:hypothetical protein